MPLPEITRATKFVTATNALLFVGAFISALAIPLSIRANNRVPDLKDRAQELRNKEVAQQHAEDQQKIETANTQLEAANARVRMLALSLEIGRAHV